MMSTNLVDLWEVPESLDYIPTFLLLFIFSVLSSWQYFLVGTWGVEM